MKKNIYILKIKVFLSTSKLPEKHYYRIISKIWRFLAFLVNFLPDKRLQRLFGLFRFAAPL